MKRQLDDWLENYMRFTQRTEPPTLYHLWSGIVAISSALRRKCYCNWGALRGYVYPNLFVALVGPPGGRKGTAMKIAKTMVQKLDDVSLGADSYGSSQALYKGIINSEASYIERNGLAKKHKSLCVWAEEFNVFLSDRDMNLISSLTDLFDCADEWRYESLARKEEKISNCFLTIFGAITPSLLQAKLTQEAVGGGLLSRIIFVVGYGPIRRVALPFTSEEEEILNSKLNNDLQQIAQLSGPFKMENSFFKKYARWYENSTAADGIQDDKFMGYNSRRALHLNKLCMVISASENDDMLIKGHHFDKALAILEATEKEMDNAFYGLGLSDRTGVYAKFLDFVKSRKEFTWTELLQKLHQDINSIDELRGFIEIGVQSKLLKEEVSPTTSNYVVQKQDYVVSSNDYLINTVLSKMDENIKNKESQNDDKKRSD